MELKQFKEELRGRIQDFALSAHLISLNKNKKMDVKEKETEEKYLKLEKWILNNKPNGEQIDTTEASSVVEQPESLDF